MIILEAFQVSGYKSRIAFPVYEITVAGNLKEMFQNIVSIGKDEYRRGSKTTVSANRNDDYWRKLINQPIPVY